MSILSGLAGALDNPVVIKDGISRMRSWRAPVAATLYLALIGGLGLVALAIATSSAQFNRPVASVVGSAVFATMAFAQLVLVCIFAPGMAAGAISGERERQTLDALLVSRLSAFSIVWGKLVASLAYSLLLILTALPLFSFTFLFGGVDLGQFALAELITVCTAVCLAAVSLLCSSIFRRSLIATVSAYLAGFALIAGTALIATIQSIFMATRSVQNSTTTKVLPSGTVTSIAGQTAPPDLPWLWYANPFYSMAANLFGLNTGSLPSGVSSLPDPWRITALVELALAAMCVYISVRLLRARRRQGGS